MKLNSKGLISICLVLIATTFAYAQQNFQGKAYYQTKTTMDIDNWGGRQMSEQQKKQMMERMKGFLEKTYILTFTQSESIYKEDEKLEAPGGGGGRGFGMMNSFTAGAQYKNIKDQQLIQDQEFFGKQFLIKDSLQNLEWEMGSETKQIGKYTCYKATAVKKVDEFDWKSMRRRDKDKDDAEKKKDSTTTDTAKETNSPIDEIEVPKEIIVTAWYTPQIPVNNGPGEYWGLPGLILEVSADRTTILCTKIILNPEEKEEIKKPSKGKEVTKKEYNDIIKKKMEEMREMYGGRNRRGPGGGGRH